MSKKIKIKKIIKAYLLCLVFGMFIFSCSGQNKEKEILRLGTSIFPPFVYVEHDGHIEHDIEPSDIDVDCITGFDIEIAKEIAADLDMTLHIEVIDYEHIFDALENGDIDFAIRAMSITEERKSLVDFSHQYYKSSQAVLIKAEHANRFERYASKESLREKRKIGVETDSTSHKAVLELISDENIFASLSMDILINELLEEQVDVLVVDYQTAKAFAEEDERLYLLSMEFDPEYYGIAVKKGNKKLLDSIDKTISKLINSGKYSKLVEEYITKDL